MNDFGSRFDSAAAKFPVMREVIARNEATTLIPNGIVGYIFASDVGPYIAYHLAKYPAFAKSLIDMACNDALRAVDDYAKVLRSIYLDNPLGDCAHHMAQLRRLAALRSPRSIVRLIDPTEDLPTS